MMRPIRSDSTIAWTFSGGRWRSFSVATALALQTSPTFLARAMASAWVIVGMGARLLSCNGQFLPRRERPIHISHIGKNCRQPQPGGYDWANPRPSKREHWGRENERQSGGAGRHR